MIDLITKHTTYQPIRLMQLLQLILKLSSCFAAAFSHISTIPASYGGTLFAHLALVAAVILCLSFVTYFFPFPCTLHHQMGLSNGPQANSPALCLLHHVQPLPSMSLYSQVDDTLSFPQKRTPLYQKLPYTKTRR